MFTDLLIIFGFLLIILIMLVFTTVSVLYAMGEWHKDRNKSKNSKPKKHENYYCIFITTHSCENPLDDWHDL